MTEELITPENLSKELLKSVFDAAYMDTSYDDEGDLRVKEGLRCYVLLPSEAKDRIKLLTGFGFKPETSEQQRLEFVNELNKQYIVVKASARKDSLQFEYDILMSGGITKKALVLMVKRFCGIPLGAIEDIEKQLGADMVN